MQKFEEEKLLKIIESHSGLSISEAHKNFMNIYVNRRIEELAITLDEFCSLILNNPTELENLINEAAIIALADSIKGVLTPQKENVLFSEDIVSPQDEDGFTFESPLADGYKIIISQRIPANGQRISQLVKNQILNTDSLPSMRSILEKMEECEQEFFGDRDNPLFSWDGIFIANVFRDRGFSVKVAVQDIYEKRRITLDEIQKWFNTESSAYGARMNEKIGSADLQKIINLLQAACEKSVFEWKSQIAFLAISHE